MAKRLCFVSTPNDAQVYREIEVSFKYYSGFALSQKRKSIHSLHESISRMNESLRVLEVSTKSDNPIGVALSAFNLAFFDDNSRREFPLENIFQSSKVFENGGPYRDLLYVHPRDAKRDKRLVSSGELKCFNYDNTLWELEPKTMFYDWIYITALNRNEELSRKILEYNAFTDIEFNHRKSFNCQARSTAIFVSLKKKGILNEALDDKEKFRMVYSEVQDTNIQTMLFK